MKLTRRELHNRFQTVRTTTYTDQASSKWTQTQPCDRERYWMANLHYVDIDLFEYVFYNQHSFFRRFKLNKNKYGYIETSII